MTQRQELDLGFGLGLNEWPSRARDYGTFYVTGYPPDITVDSILEVPAGSYSLTGIAPDIETGLDVAVPLGSYSLTGFAPSLFINADILVPAGGFTLTGFAPTIQKFAAPITAPVGSYSLTGIAPTLTLDVKAPTGSFTLTGVAPAVTRQLLSAPPVGSFALTGFAPAIVQSQFVNVPTGSISLTGFAPRVSEEVPLGTFTLTGFAPTINVTGAIDVPAGSFVLTGAAPGITRQLVTAAPAGSLALTGFAPTIRRQLLTSVPAGSFAQTGFAPATQISQQVAVPLGTYALTGQAPDIAKSIVVNVPAGSFTQTGQTPTIAVSGGGITFVAATGAEIPSGAGGTLTLPSHNEDDLLIICEVSDGNLQSTAPSGYTDVGLTSPSFMGLRVYYKIAGASESNPSIPSSGGRKSAAICMAMRFPTAPTSIATDFTEGSNTSSDTQTFSSLSVNDGDLLICFAAQDDSDIDASSFDAALNDAQNQPANLGGGNTSAMAFMAWDEVETTGSVTLGNLVWGKTESIYGATIRFRPS